MATINSINANQLLGTTASPSWVAPTCTTGITLGIASSASGTATFLNSANAFTTVFQASASAAASVTYTWPVNAPGSSGYVLSATTGGVMSWVAQSGGSMMTWTDVTGTTQAAAINTGYIADNVGLVTVTLPSTAALGSVVEVAGKGAGGWKIAQNASQFINFGNVATTTGTGGYLASTNAYDCIRLLCTTANNGWVVLSAQGNITWV